VVEPRQTDLNRRQAAAPNEPQHLIMQGEETRREAESDDT
jgi:hypothetical protein